MNRTMLTSLFAAAGIDYGQWKALTRVALKLDFRKTSLGSSRMGRQLRGGAALVSQLVVYTLFGAFMAFFAWMSQDLFLVGLVLSSYTMFIVGTAVLLDHNSALTSATDYGVLGFQPVSSRTYFAAKLANVLVYTLAITTIAAYLPMGVLFARRGLAIGVAGMAAIYGTSIAVALAILMGYAWMLQRIGAAALKRALSYVQLVMSFAVYGGYFLMSGVISRQVMTMTIQKTTWWMLYPGAWFASYLELAAGHRGAAEIGPSIASIALLGLVATGIGGRLSLDYSARLADIAATPVTQKRRGARPGEVQSTWWFRSGEARAMAVLIRSQFRNDQRFRMTVLGILPLTLLYVFMGVHDGTVVDPFVASAGRHGPFSLVTVAVLMFPSMLKLSLSRSESFQASWVFFASPTDRIRIIRSSKNVLVAFFLLPYLLFVGALYLYFVHNVWHVLLYVLFLGLLSHLVLQFVVFVSPELPFSRPWQKTRTSSSMFGFMIVVFIAAGLLQALGPYIYAHASALGITLVALAGASAAVDLATRARVAAQTQELEFEG